MRIQLQATLVVVTAIFAGSALGSDGFDLDYEVRSGDHNSDGLLDLLVSKPRKVITVHGDVPIPILVANGEPDFVLEQDWQGNFSVAPVGAHMPTSSASWSPTEIVLTAVEFSLDDLADAFLTNIDSIVPGADDLIVFAEPGTAMPRFVSAFDDNMKEFVEQVSDWVVDPDYFRNIAYTETPASGWIYLTEVLNLNSQVFFNGIEITGDPHDGTTSPAICAILPCSFNSFSGWDIYISGAIVTYDFSKPEINQSALAFTNAAATDINVPRGGRLIPLWFLQIPWIIGDFIDAWLSRNDWPAEYGDIGIDPSKAMILIHILNHVCRNASEDPSDEYFGASPADACYAKAAAVIGERSSDGSVLLPEDIVNHDKFDRDQLALHVPVLAALERRAKRSTQRHHCTYVKKSGIRAYYGRTTARINETCQSAVARRNIAHQRVGYLAGLNSAIVDSDNVGVGAYSVMRGREQQLIDQHVYDVPMPWNAKTHGLDYKPYVMNRIRGVARFNVSGCTYWLASEFAEGPVQGQFVPYTGRKGSPVLGCSNVPDFP